MKTIKISIFFGVFIFLIGLGMLSAQTNKKIKTKKIDPLIELQWSPKITELKSSLNKISYVNRSTKERIQLVFSPLVTLKGEPEKGVVVFYWNGDSDDVHLLAALHSLSDGKAFESLNAKEKERLKPFAEDGMQVNFILKKKSVMIYLFYTDFVYNDSKHNIGDLNPDTSLYMFLLREQGDVWNALNVNSWFIYNKKIDDKRLIRDMYFHDGSGADWIHPMKR